MSSIHLTNLKTGEKSILEVSDFQVSFDPSIANRYANLKGQDTAIAETYRAAAEYARKLDEVIREAISMRLGNDWTAESLAGRVECIVPPTKDEPDVYFLDGQPILEVWPVPKMERFDVLGPARTSLPLFNYRFIAP